MRCLRCTTGNWGGRCSTPTTRAIPNGSLLSCSTSIAASVARPAPWRASPPGPSPAGRNTCGGTTWRASPTAGIRSSGTGNFWRCWNGPTRKARSGIPPRKTAGKRPMERSRGKQFSKRCPKNNTRKATPCKKPPAACWATFPATRSGKRPIFTKTPPGGPTTGTGVGVGKAPPCPPTIPGSSICNASAITAPIPAAWPLARARPSTSGRKTVWC